MLTVDARGQRFPNQRILKPTPIRICDADIYGTLEPLNIHGPLFTSYLVAFASHFRATPRYTRNRLGDFYTSTDITHLGTAAGGPILDRPEGQFPKPEEGTPKRSMMILHENNARANRILKAVERHHLIKHGGWWRHKIANAHITASLHLAALEAEVPFIPPDCIAADKGVRIDGHTLVPDYLMGIGRFYALETDLGNEPGHVKDPEMYHRRKSYERMFTQYSELIVRRQDRDGIKLYNTAYRIPREKPLMVLFVTTVEAKLALMNDLIMELTDNKGCNWFLMKHIPSTAFSAYHKPRPLLTLWTEPWKRAGRPGFYINNMTRQ